MRGCGTCLRWPCSWGRGGSAPRPLPRGRALELNNCIAFSSFCTLTCRASLLVSMLGSLHAARFCSALVVVLVLCGGRICFSLRYPCVRIFHPSVPPFFLTDFPLPNVFVARGQHQVLCFKEPHSVVLRRRKPSARRILGAILVDHHQQTVCLEPWPAGRSGVCKFEAHLEPHQLDSSSEG